MKSSLYPLLLLWMVFGAPFPTIAGSSVSAQIIPLELDVATAGQLTVTESPSGTYTIETTGVDPKIRTVSLTENYNPDSVYVISFEYLATDGLDNLQIFFGPPISGPRSITFGSLEASPTFRVFKAFMKFESDAWDYSTDFRIDWGVSAGQEITVRNLELRAPTEREVIPFSLNPAARNQAPTTANANGGFEITTTGGDPWVRSTVITQPYNPDSVYVLTFDYTTTSGLNDFQIFFGNPDSPTRRAQYGALSPASDTTRFTAVFKADVANWDQFYDRFRFDWGSMAGLDIQVSNFILREPTNAEMKLVVPPADNVFVELNVNNTSPFLTATQTSPSTYQLLTVGPDPWIRAVPVTTIYDTEETYIIEFDYQASADYNELQIFYGPPITGVNSLITEPLPAATEWTTYTINTKLLVDNFQDGSWTEYRFDFGRNEDAALSKTFDIRNIIIRKPTAQELFDEQNSDKFVSRALNTAYLEYLATGFSDSVGVVDLNMEEVTITGVVSPGGGQRYLVEVLPEEYGFELDTFNTVVPLLVAGDSFGVVLPRYVGLIENGRSRDRDRIYSRWAIAEQSTPGTYQLTSFMKWPTCVLDAAINNQVEDKATSLKGIDGLTPQSLSMFSDLEDLEVKSMKLNLLIQGIFSLDTTTMFHLFNGKKYGINQTFVNNLDSRIKALTDADIKSSLVYLVPLNQISDTVRTLFTHPDARLGNYSMANVASAQGVEYYTAITDFVAERYSRPDSLYGRLDQWIIHNEVDAHRAWTHAGEKPVDLYTQLYDRSMRLVHYTIRMHDPTAKVFSSFTKHWNSKAVEEQNFRSLDILNRLTDLMGKEGDYEWGIGWHSYPTNLADPRVWLDPIPQTRLDLLTPQITPRNLEMIDAYVRQESVLYNGKKVRTVLLSENGFNSNPDTPGANEGRQAAALAYFWKKAENGRLPAIENIQLHRWVDFPTEGGILFGLWTTMPGTNGVFDEKKEGWFVWDAAGTADEESVFLPYLDTIGINDWSEIQFDVPTETTPWNVNVSIDCAADFGRVVMSYNGEKKIPQADGTLKFYNVASDVPQPYTITSDGEVVLSGRLDVNGPLNETLSLCVLPVEFLHFSATRDEKSVRLDWSTSFEAENAGFELQRSADGSVWASLIFAEAKGAGSVQEYVHLDEQPLSGNNYYRVVQSDLDGEVSISAVRQVRFIGREGALTITPNPSSGYIRLGLPEGVVARQLQLIDALGRVSELSVPSGSRDLRLATQAKGTYVLRLIATDGSVYSGKVVLR